MEDLFEREINKPTVFADKNVLSPHYIPAVLPHREEQINKIMKMLSPALEKKKPNNIFMYGKVGSGKTCVTKHIIEKLLTVKDKYNAIIDAIYVNCNIQDTKYQVLLKCVEYCYPNEKFEGYPFSHLFSRLLKYVEDKESNLIIVLDEIDKVKNIDDLLYALTRANDELKRGSISIIGITNNIALKQQLDPRSKSTLCEEEIIFPPYNAEQLRDILKNRAEIGFKKGKIDESAISLAAAFAAQESGDARYALKLIIKAGELADEHNREKVTDREVREARLGVEKEIVYDLILNLPDHQKLVLYAIACLTLDPSHYHRLDGIVDKTIVFSGEVYEEYEKICKKMGEDPRTARWCRQYLNELDMLGLITTTLSGKGIKGNTTLIRLSFPADKVKEVLEKSLKLN
ncbi:MAG: orc1/cdc6 family replication initiation protein [archaeon]